MCPNRERLAALLRNLSVRRGGSFQLVSGAVSDVYVDAKLATCRADGMQLVGQVFLQKMEELHWRPTAVGGLIIGATPIVLAIARESLDSPSPINAFLVRKEPKPHGLQKPIEGLAETRDLDVVIVDDVCTAGGSTERAVLLSREAGMNVLGAICLVDREAGARERLAKHGCELHHIFTLAELLEERESSEPALPPAPAARFS